jgi:hypothetical protein
VHSVIAPAIRLVLKRMNAPFVSTEPRGFDL